MKRLLTAVLACAISGTVSMSSGQACDDAYDANLCVYAQNDAPVSIRDGAASAFWANWSGKDYIEMIAPADCYPDRCGFVGTDDAVITIKAAASSKGLYMLSEVRDNTWVDRASADDWGADAIDFFFDAMDANAIWTCTGCLIGLYDSKLTYTTQQFQVWMGASAPPPGCRMAFYDDNLWSWQSLGLDWNQLSLLYNVDIDVITVDANRKAQEWFFPWVNFGKGLAVGAALDGMKLAFSGGYNDKDGDNTNPDCLRWLGKDPWIGDVNYWGDFVLQTGIGNVEPVSVLDRGISARGNLSATRGPAEFYTLQGQKITSGAMSHATAGAVMVKRTAGANASVRVLGR